jgi:hypothetical protein
MGDTREVFLPLTTEEIRILQSLLAGEKLPAVIEGRAGSGKTTLLIYYTAERLSHPLPAGARPGQGRVLVSEGPGAERLSHPLPDGARVLYLTQNKSLLEKAEPLIEQIVKLLIQDRGGNADRIKGEYRTYHDFALSQLPDERKERFRLRIRKRGWIDFDHFVGLLRGQDNQQQDRCPSPFARNRECNPEAVWFILRSYIKGYKITDRGEDRWMSSEEYKESEEIPAKDRQVSADLYEKVWKHIWPWYKKLTVPCEENGYEPRYWDDLDLAWEVLEHRSSDAPTYAILICDEVQDLTRVELAALLGSLQWARYDLRDLAPNRGWGQRELRLPIILAGDAHQTINPAVFRWERVSADLAKALVAHLPTLPEPRVERLQLQYNYRNARSIGQLCNALQHLRQRTLGQQSRLQLLWKLPDTQPNQRVRQLIIEPKPGQLEELLKTGVLIVVPEDDDPNLEHTRPFWEALGFPRPPENVNNEPGELRNKPRRPADIKGLELDCVAVVGFGVLWHLWLQQPQYRQLAEFWNWQNAADNEEISEDLRFLVEYFLNRLYVAVSRAREELWIIETEQGWDAFWARLKDWVDEQWGQQVANAGTGAAAEARIGPADDEQLQQWATTRSADPPTDVVDRPYAFVYSKGDLRQLSTVFEGNPENLRRLAEDFERVAHDGRNPNLAESAAYYYSLVGDTVNQHKMLAYCLYYDGEVLQAARRMISIVDDRCRQLGSDWYWEAAGEDNQTELAWREISEDERIAPSWRREIAECMVALMLERTVDATFVALLADLLQRRTPQRNELKPEHWATWEKVYIQLVQSANHLSPDSFAVQQQAYDVALRWTPTSRRTLHEYFNQLGRLAFTLAQRCDDIGVGRSYYREAAEHWENAGRTRERDYHIAKAESTGYPQCLQYWETAGDYERILKEYRDHSGHSLARDNAQRVARASREIWKPKIEQAMRGTTQAGQNPAESFTPVIREARRELSQLYKHLGLPDFERDWAEWIEDLLLRPIKQVAQQRMRQLFFEPVVHNQDISGLVGQIVTEAHGALRQLYQAVDIEVNFDEYWTNWMLDLVISCDRESQSLAPGTLAVNILRQVIYGVAQGFALGSEPAVLAHRFRGSWETRNNPGTNWSRFQYYLQQIVRSVRQLISSRFGEQDAGRQEDESQVEIARLCRLVLGILWRFEGQNWRDHLPEYLALPRTEVRNPVNYLEQITQEMRSTVEEAISCIADLPEDWIRRHEHQRDRRPWDSLLRWTDVLARDFYSNLQDTLQLVANNAQARADVAPYEWWMLVGRFIKQGTSRALVRGYYTAFKNLNSLLGWPDNVMQEIEAERVRSEQRYRDWVRQQMYVEVKPGEIGQSETLELMYLLGREEDAFDKLLIFIMPDRRLAILAVPRQAEATPHWWHLDPQINLTQTEDDNTDIRWVLSCNTGAGERSVQLRWVRDHRVLYVRADRTFVVSFPAAETPAG